MMKPKHHRLQSTVQLLDAASAITGKKDCGKAAAMALLHGGDGTARAERYALGDWDPEEYADTCLNSLPASMALQRVLSAPGSPFSARLLHTPATIDKALAQKKSKGLHIIGVVTFDATGSAEAMARVASRMKTRQRKEHAREFLRASETAFMKNEMYIRVYGGSRVRLSAAALAAILKQPGRSSVLVAAAKEEAAKHILPSDAGTAAHTLDCGAALARALLSPGLRGQGTLNFPKASQGSSSPLEKKSSSPPRQGADDLDAQSSDDTGAQSTGPSLIDDWSVFSLKFNHSNLAKCHRGMSAAKALKDAVNASGHGKVTARLFGRAEFSRPPLRQCLEASGTVGFIAFMSGGEAAAWERTHFTTRLGEATYTAVPGSIAVGGRTADQSKEAARFGLTSAVLQAASNAGAVAVTVLAVAQTPLRMAHTKQGVEAPLGGHLLGQLLAVLTQGLPAGNGGAQLPGSLLMAIKHKQAVVLPDDLVVTQLVRPRAGGDMEEALRHQADYKSWLGFIAGTGRNWKVFLNPGRSWIEKDKHADKVALWRSASVKADVVRQWRDDPGYVIYTVESTRWAEKEGALRRKQEEAEEARQKKKAEEEEAANSSDEPSHIRGTVFRKRTSRSRQSHMSDEEADNPHDYEYLAEISSSEEPSEGGSDIVTDDEGASDLQEFGGAPEPKHWQLPPGESTTALQLLHPGRKHVPPQHRALWEQHVFLTDGSPPETTSSGTDALALRHEVKPQSFVPLKITPSTLAAPVPGPANSEVASSKATAAQGIFPASIDEGMVTPPVSAETEVSPPAAAAAAHTEGQHSATLGIEPLGIPPREAHTKANNSTLESQLAEANEMAAGGDETPEQRQLRLRIQDAVDRRTNVKNLQGSWDADVRSSLFIYDGVQKCIREAMKNTKKSSTLRTAKAEAILDRVLKEDKGIWELALAKSKLLQGKPGTAKDDILLKIVCRKILNKTNLAKTSDLARIGANERKELLETIDEAIKHQQEALEALGGSISGSGAGCRVIADTPPVYLPPLGRSSQGTAQNLQLILYVLYALFELRRIVATKPLLKVESHNALLTHIVWQFVGLVDSENDMLDKVKYWPYWAWSCVESIMDPAIKMLITENFKPYYLNQTFLDVLQGDMPEEDEMDWRDEEGPQLLMRNGKLVRNIRGKPVFTLKERRSKDLALQKLMSDYVKGLWKAKPGKQGIYKRKRLWTEGAKVHKTRYELKKLRYPAYILSLGRRAHRRKEVIACMERVEKALREKGEPIDIGRANRLNDLLEIYKTEEDAMEKRQTRLRDELLYLIGSQQLTSRQVAVALGHALRTDRDGNLRPKPYLILPASLRLLVHGVWSVVTTEDAKKAPGEGEEQPEISAAHGAIVPDQQLTMSGEDAEDIHDMLTAHTTSGELPERPPLPQYMILKRAMAYATKGRHEYSAYTPESCKTKMCDALYIDAKQPNWRERGLLRQALCSKKEMNQFHLRFHPDKLTERQNKIREKIYQSLPGETQNILYETQQLVRRCNSDRETCANKNYCGPQGNNAPRVAEKELWEGLKAKTTADLPEFKGARSQSSSESRSDDPETDNDNEPDDEDDAGEEVREKRRATEGKGHSGKKDGHSDMQDRKGNHNGGGKSGGKGDSKNSREGSGGKGGSKNSREGSGGKGGSNDKEGNRDRLRAVLRAGPGRSPGWRRSRVVLRAGPGRSLGRRRSLDRRGGHDRAPTPDSSRDRRRRRPDRRGGHDGAPTPDSSRDRRRRRPDRRGGHDGAPTLDSSRDERRRRPNRRRSDDGGRRHDNSQRRR